MVPAVVVTVAATVISGECVLIARVVVAVADMASPVARLVAVEVIELLFAAPRQRTVVTVTRIVAVINMTVEVFGTVVPVASADEYSVHEPVWPVVAVGRTVIWSVVEVPIGAHRLHSKADGDLGLRSTRTA